MIFPVMVNDYDGIESKRKIIFKKITPFFI